MTRLRKKCKRCAGEGTLRFVRVSTDPVLHTKIRTEVERECGGCLGTGFDESSEALTEAE